MTARLVGWCAQHGRIVVVAVLVLLAGSELARRRISRDVLPDLSDPRIVLVVDWMGHPATEVATSVTRVLTEALQGTPGALVVRGSSMTGMAFVEVVFSPAADLQAGRKTVLQRAEGQAARLPPAARLEVGPPASSTGWVFQYLLLDPLHASSMQALRRIQEDVLRPLLAAIPGVAEVATVGGEIDEVMVEADPEALSARGLAFSDLVAALRPLSGAPARRDLHEIETLPVPVAASAAGPADVPWRVKDLARVRPQAGMPAGLADAGGYLHAVGGIVVADRRADPARVAGQVRAALDRARGGLPRGVELTIAYDRKDLVDQVEGTFLRALGEEVVVVVLVILIFLLHARAALVPLATLPTVVLLTFGAMWLLHVPATIMSLGGIGIALGMAIDAEVVALEACHRRLETLDPASPPSARRAALLAAASSFAPAILTSLLITAIAFLPAFAFTGETGRLLRPLATTKTLVIGTAAVVSLMLAPVLRARLLVGPVRAELDNPLVRGLLRCYRPLVQLALSRPALTLATAGLAVLSCLPIVSRLDREFLPRVDEGDLLFMPTTVAGVPPHRALDELERQDRILSGFPEVASVFGKIGRADSATDRAPYSMVETTIRLRPRAEWPKRPRARWYSGCAPPFLRKVFGVAWPEEARVTTGELVELMDAATRRPGWRSAWTAPVRGRLDMMATGVRTPVGIRVVASDAARLETLGAAVATIARDVRGARSAVGESLGGEYRAELELDPASLARHGVEPALARSTADLLLGGGQVGDLERDGRRIRVLLSQASTRHGLDRLREITIRSRGGDSGGRSDPVPLGLLARTATANRPAMVSSERGDLVAYVQVDLVDGTDLSRWVEEAQRAIDGEMAAGRLSLEPGERIEWTGQYELLVAGERRARWLIPIAVLAMLVLLLAQFRSLAAALIVLASVPFALVGSLWTLYLLDYALSAPVWLGLLSVIGLAMQTGVVMVVYVDEAFYRRLRAGRIRNRDDIVAAHAEGTVRRLRPKIMTVATMAAGLLPLVWTQGAGAEVMRRIAAPMLGGLATSAFLTLEVLPVLYTIWRQSQLRRAQRAGRPIEALLAGAPPWAR